MTDTQVYLAVGVPMIANGIFTTLLVLYPNARLDSIKKRFDARFDYQRSYFDQGFTDLEKIWDEKLLRVEGVIDARLKHLEDPS